MNEKLQTVEASLAIEMWVTCPNDECEQYIDLLDQSDTNEKDHNDDGYLLRQMFPDNGEHADFECDEVVCSDCGTKFNVKGLMW